MSRSVDEWRAFYDASFPEAAGYAVRLTGGDRELAEDLVHDAYLAMVSAWQAGRVERLAPGWLIVAVRRRYLNWLRDRSRELRRVQRVASLDGRSMADESLSVDVVRLLAGVTPRSRVALVLRYVDALSVPEIAGAMGVSVRAAESLLARARRELRASAAAIGWTANDSEEIG